MSVFRPRKPWESEYASYTDDELLAVYRDAVERNDWSTLTKLQRPFSEGAPPPGFSYREQADFVDRR
ncbi:MAG: hypothetical protein ACYC9L_05545 [Sulfuricaulis sp.]